MKPMKIKQQVVFSILTLLTAAMTACTTTTDPAEAYKGETAQQIFQGGEDALRDRSYAEAVKRFEALDVQYPFGKNTETAQLHIIFAYYKNSDYLSAETAADRFIHAHPTSANVDYAYYMRGLSNYYQNLGVFERLFSVDYATRDLTQVKKSFNDFAQLEHQFPQSPYASAAHQYMIYLRDVLANHQLEVAQFYFNRQAYVAAVNRAGVVVENYQGAAAVPDALVMMAKSYHQLHQSQLEAQTIRVIQYNFPGSRYTNAVSEKNIGSADFALTPKKDRIIASPAQDVITTPPTAAQTISAYNEKFPANGVRGTVTPIGQIAKELKNAGTVALNKPVSTVTTPQTGARDSMMSASRVEARQSAQQEVVATKENNSEKLTLGGLWNKLANSRFLGTHEKADTTQPSVAQQQSVPAQESVAQNGMPAADLAAAQEAIDQRQVAKNDHNFSRFSENGMRR